MTWTNYSALPLNTVVRSYHGNKWRKFPNGWSPLVGTHWDRWTVYSDAAMSQNHPFTDPA